MRKNTYILTAALISFILPSPLFAFSRYDSAEQPDPSIVKRVSAALSRKAMTLHSSLLTRDETVIKFCFQAGLVEFNGGPTNLSLLSKESLACILAAAYSFKDSREAFFPALVQYAVSQFKPQLDQIGTFSVTLDASHVLVLHADRPNCYAIVNPDFNLT